MWDNIKIINRVNSATWPWNSFTALKQFLWIKRSRLWFIAISQSHIWLHHQDIHASWFQLQNSYRAHCIRMHMWATKQQSVFLGTFTVIWSNISFDLSVQFFYNVWQKLILKHDIITLIAVSNEPATTWSTGKWELLHQTYTTKHNIIVFKLHLKYDKKIRFNLMYSQL